jgi:hypothetical protein
MDMKKPHLFIFFRQNCFMQFKERVPFKFENKKYQQLNIE